jgi:SAM-dependent methyltransferase
MSRRVVEFYGGYDEDGRLARPKSRLEFLRTQELLRARLPPPPARVLDIGGGTGVHARWLREDGYDVALIDLVPEHVALAARELDARVGDARALDVASGAFDVCLLLGPLYHLPEREERLQALREAARVATRLVVVAALSRFAWPLYALRDGGELDAAAIAETFATGRGDPVGALPDAYSHTPAELAGELRDAGLADVAVLGLEGPGWPHADTGAALRAARLCDGVPELTAASAHLLAVGAPG